MKKSDLRKLLENYKEQCGCDFMIYDGKFECIFSTSIDPLLLNKDLLKKYAVISFEVGKEQYHLMTQDKRNKDFLMMIAIACKNMLEVARGELSENELLVMAIKGGLSDKELADFACKYKHKKNEKFILFRLEIKEECIDNAMEILNNLLMEDEIKLIHNESVLLVLLKYEKQDIEQFSHTIIDTLNAEIMENVSLTYGYPFVEIENIATAALQAYETSMLRKIFYPNQVIMDYKTLGLAKIITHLGKTDCVQIAQDFTDLDFAQFDNEEDLHTIYTFFENNLNISEAARKLYLHRNTLIYRLDKYEKVSNLDIRKFDDAIKFKLALMIYQFSKK